MSISYLHLIGELRYTTNGTSVAAHDCVAYKDVGQGREQDVVSFITPWNSSVIPRRHALSCTTTDALFMMPN